MVHTLHSIDAKYNSGLDTHKQSYLPVQYNNNVIAIQEKYNQADREGN